MSGALEATRPETSACVLCEQELRDYEPFLTALVLVDGKLKNVAFHLVCHAGLIADEVALALDDDERDDEEDDVGRLIAETVAAVLSKGISRGPRRRRR